MHFRFRPLIPVLGAVALAACQESERAPEPADIAAQGIPPAVRVTANEQHHTVYLMADKGTLTVQEGAGLATFLNDVGATGRSATHVTIRGPVSPALLKPIARAVVASGVNPAKIDVDPIAAGPAQPHSPGLQVAVEVVTSTFAVDYPQCPRTSQLSLAGVENANTSNFGCSSITNLEAMIEDPRDLVQGESGGQTDAKITTAALKRLHDGKTYQLKQENSETLNSSSSSSSGGGGDSGAGGGGQ
jgi:pilus biogenesis lipoprotein CpaD